MRPYQQLASILFAVLGIFLVVQGLDLGIEGNFGPGPGFMAFVVGVLIIVVNLAWGLQVTVAPPVAIPRDLLPDRVGLFRIIATIAALILLGAFLTLLGFMVTVFAFLLVTLFTFGRDHAVTKVVVAFAFSFGLAWVFEHLLHVPLPSASLEALSTLGL